MHLPQHMICCLWLAGMDGFYDRRSCQAAAGNPSSWAGYTGQDFLPQHAVAAIDFAAIHLWPDNWKRTEQSFGNIWLTTHSANGAQLQKPVVLEEFGKVGIDYLAAWVFLQPDFLCLLLSKLDPLCVLHRAWVVNWQRVRLPHSALAGTRRCTTL